MDRKVEIASAAMDMMFNMLIETTPDDRKAIFKAPLAVSRMNRKANELLKLVSKATPEGNQDAFIATQIVAMLNGFIEQMDNYLSMQEPYIKADMEQDDD